MTGRALSKMNGLPYYKAYPRDFFGGTVGMDSGLKGMYRLVLDLIYMHGGMLPDDPRYISGQIGSSVKAWNIAKGKLLAMGKLVLVETSLTNLRAISELEMLERFQEKQRKNGGGDNENKGLAKATALPLRDYTDTDTDKSLSYSSFPVTAGLRLVGEGEGEGFLNDGFLEGLRQAVGLTAGAGAGSRYWHGPGALAHVRRWHEVHGLSGEQILSVAAQSRARHPEPPKGPKALDGWMATAATALASAAAVTAGPIGQIGGGAKPVTGADIEAARIARLQWLADMINADGFCPHTLVTPSMAREMLARGLVTAERLRARCVAA